MRQAGRCHFLPQYGIMGAGAHGALIDFSRTRPGRLKGPQCGYCQRPIVEGRCGCAPRNMTD